MLKEKHTVALHEQACGFEHTNSSSQVEVLGSPKKHTLMTPHEARNKEDSTSENDGEFNDPKGHDKRVHDLLHPEFCMCSVAWCVHMSAHEVSSALQSSKLY